MAHQRRIVDFSFIKKEETDTQLDYVSAQTNSIDHNCQFRYCQLAETRNLFFQ